MPTLGVNSKDLIYSSLNIDQELTKVNPVKALTSGKFTSKDIGKTVYLSNSNSKCQEYIVIGINHDNTSGTVDLISKYQAVNLQRSTYDFDEVFNTIISGDFYWVTHFIDGFQADVRNALKTMNKKKWQYSGIVYNGGSTSRLTNDSDYSTKAAIPSLAELGYYYGSNKQGANGGKYWSYYANGVGTTYLNYHIGTVYEYFANTNGSDTLIAPVSMSDNGDDRKSYLLRDVWFNVTDGAPFVSDSHGYFPAPSYTSYNNIFFANIYDQYNYKMYDYANISHYYGYGGVYYCNLALIIRF